MLTEQHIKIVKSTIPLLESTGPQLTAHFYQRMFAHNPELKHIFNLSHQHSGGQPAALFDAIAAYAKHIDQLDVLHSAVERIAHKHTSFNIRAEHYPIVGHHLLETLRELAPTQFTKEVEEAWGAAYQFLANIFIQREQELYEQSSQKQGGWEGERAFKVVKKQMESDNICSLYFAPCDEQAVAAYLPGQYIGIRVNPKQSDYQEIRQYSLSDKPNGETYRISVKREEGNVPGVVSNHIHDALKEGDKVDLYAPAGDFYFVDRQRPVVLISAGVGITPMQAMLEHLADVDYQAPVHFLHACDYRRMRAFGERTATLTHTLDLHHHTWYRLDPVEDDSQSYGLMNLADVEAKLPLQTADFYLCGPLPFMQFINEQLQALGVADARIHYEVFGPHQSL